MTGFPVSKNLYFWQLIPGFPDTYFPLTYQSTTSCKISEKTNEQSPRYLKTDIRLADRLMDEQTDKSDYYGPHQVNPGSKISYSILPD